MNFRYTTNVAIASLLVFALIIFSCSRKGNPEITEKELLEHIKYLSSDALQGRLTGSVGDSLAAEYIRTKLASYGFVPVTGDGFQRFRVIKRVVAGKNKKLSIDSNDLIPEIDFMPLSFSSDGSVEAEVVFAGYGFNIQNENLTWNDYENLDLKGKWVMILRGDPEPGSPGGPSNSFNTDRDKAMVAKDMGAVGVLMVSGEIHDYEDAFEPLHSEGYSIGIPAFRIKRKSADLILSASKKDIASLEKMLNRNRKPVNVTSRTVVKGVVEIGKEYSETRNVVMELPGEDPILKNEYIIIGAHFDHLGMGGAGSSSRAVDTTGIHHGADDNASGIAVMLELAEKFAGTKGRNKRSILCIAFSGEELGLLGSKQFTGDPGIDLSNVNVMINLDMVGRLNENKILNISGVGTASGLKDIVKAESDTSVIKLALTEEGYGPSDHSSFYGKDIPVLFYFTGAHLDYHTPDDTYDKLNYEGMILVSGLVFNVAEELASSASRLKFRESGPKTAASGRMKGVTLGIMPDFAGVVKNGLRADFVTPGKPAALGGMKKGDIITAINGQPVSNIQDYMFRMGKLKQGQTISVEILRNDKKEVLLIQL